MNEQIPSIVRSVGKLIAGALMAKGFGTSELWEAVIGGLVGGAMMLWSWWSARQKNTLKAAVSGDISLKDPKVTAIVSEPAPTKSHVE